MRQRKARSSFTSVLLLLAIAASLAVYALSKIAWQRPALSSRVGPALSEGKSWGYQLQGIEPRRIPSHIDVLVTDYSRDGSSAGALTTADVAVLKQRAGGRPRIVLCYLSIGEAETYRYYWMPTWSLSRPRWLGAENPEWKGNHPVRFWDKDWQRIIVSREASLLDRVAEMVLPWRRAYLDRIIEAGFDGVYLDRVDVFGEFDEERRTARRDMIAFVKQIADYGRARRAGFLVVPQNAEELVTNAGYLALIDGIGKEDLVFGANEDGVENEASDVTTSMRHLDRVTRAGKPVLSVEYVKEPDKRARAILTARQKGYLPLLSDRALDSVPEPVPELPAAADMPTAPGESESGGVDSPAAKP